MGSLQSSFVSTRMSHLWEALCRAYDRVGDLKARPIYCHKRESIDAHLAVVFTALAVTRFI